MCITHFLLLVTMLACDTSCEAFFFSTISEMINEKQEIAWRRTVCNDLSRTFLVCYSFDVLNKSSTMTWNRRWKRFACEEKRFQSRWCSSWQWRRFEYHFFLHSTTVFCLNRNLSSTRREASCAFVSCDAYYLSSFTNFSPWRTTRHHQSWFAFLIKFDSGLFSFATSLRSLAHFSHSTFFSLIERFDVLCTIMSSLSFWSSVCSTKWRSFRGFSTMIVSKHRGLLRRNSISSGCSSTTRSSPFK